ncbi:MAG: S41 family peptidase [Heyndrickxia sp.]
MKQLARLLAVFFMFLAGALGSCKEYSSNYKRKWVNTLEEWIHQEEIVEFVHKSIHLLKANYIFPEISEEIGAYLESKLKDGVYNRSFTFKELTELLNKDLQSINGDRHLHIYIQKENITETNAVNEEEMLGEYRRVAEKNNYGFHRIERLPGNIGYIDLRVFYEPNIGSETATHVMNTLSHTDALIVDLRKNIGGSPYMVSLIASYLVNEPTHIESFYRRDEDSTTQVWTMPHVPGKLYGDKPVYVLTSKKTFSAGELFAYSLKQLGRITVIGDFTGGAANPGNYHQVTKHLRLFIPSGKSINPVTGANWEGNGVEPDFQVDAEKAFHIAYEKALLQVKEKYQELSGFAFLVKEMDEELVKISSLI